MVAVVIETSGCSPIHLNGFTIVYWPKGRDWGSGNIETYSQRNRAAYRIPVDCDEILTTNGSYIMSHAEYIIPVEDC